MIIVILYTYIYKYKCKFNFVFNFGRDGVQQICCSYIWAYTRHNHAFGGDDLVHN